MKGEDTPGRVEILCKDIKQRDEFGADSGRWGQRVCRTGDWEK